MFKKATKQKSKLRCAVFGPSGSGKTFSALRIATGLGGTIGVIDTEHGSASKYADRFSFDVCEPDNRTIDGYLTALRAAADAGLETVIIDSMSHGWQELLEEVDRLANTKYRGNTWSAWSEGTPKQRRLIDGILRFPGHIIATMRSKTEWTQEQDTRGKARPVRVGLAPEQGKGIEYEFDMLLELNVDHMATVIKDRTGKFQDKIIEKPGELFGKELAAWLADGTEPVATFPQTIHQDPAGNVVTNNGEIIARNGEHKEPPKPSSEYVTWRERIVKLADSDEFTGCWEDQKAIKDWIAANLNSHGYRTAEQIVKTTDTKSLEGFYTSFRTECLKRRNALIAAEENADGGK